MIRILHHLALTSAKGIADQDLEPMLKEVAKALKDSLAKNPKTVYGKWAAKSAAHHKWLSQYGAEIMYEHRFRFYEAAPSEEDFQKVRETPQWLIKKYGRFDGFPVDIRQDVEEYFIGLKGKGKWTHRRVPSYLFSGKL